MAHTNITDTSLDPDAPITSALGYAFRDNLIATAGAEDGAPVVNAGWYPYDMVEYGDGATGEIYSFGADGALSAVETPDFADGYEYMIFASLVECSTAGQNLIIDLYRATDAGYSIAWTSSGSANNATAIAEIVAPRINKTLHPIHGWAVLNTTTEDFSASVYDATVQKIGKARVRWSSGNIDAGAIYMYRRGMK